MANRRACRVCQTVLGVLTAVCDHSHSRRIPAIWPSWTVFVGSQGPYLDDVWLPYWP